MSLQSLELMEEGPNPFVNSWHLCSFSLSLCSANYSHDTESGCNDTWAIRLALNSQVKYVVSDRTLHPHYVLSTVWYDLTSNSIGFQVK